MKKWLPLLMLVAITTLLSTRIAAGPKEEVAAVLDRFHSAAAAADMKTYSAQMTEGMVFLGTDASERWQGALFLDFARPHFDSGKGWTYVPRERHIDFAPSGNVAWFDELLDNQKLGLCRGSGLLLLMPDGWKIAQYNLSMPVPNDMIEQVAVAIGADQPGSLPEPAKPNSAKRLETDPKASSVSAETGEEASEDMSEPTRCRKRHKTNRMADC